MSSYYIHNQLFKINVITLPVIAYESNFRLFVKKNVKFYHICKGRTKHRGVISL